MKEKILNILMNNMHQYISGEALAEECGVSRAAVWKHINGLKKEGYRIETLNKKGYKLINNNEKLLPAEIQSGINTHKIATGIIHFDTVDSTNSYAKSIAEGQQTGTVIISEEQVGGRGRMGRQWSSPRGEGIFMSIILKPKISPLEGSKLTQIAAAAVCQAIRKVTGLEAKIKWPNDIVIEGKKVCGILTEMSAELNEVHYLVVGIGVNVNNTDLPDEIKDKATSLKVQLGKDINRRDVVCAIINLFEPLYDDFVQDGTLEKTIEICRKESAVLGKSIIILQKDMEVKAKAIEITNEGLLKVQYEDGREDMIISGEVSIRGEKGYV
ncbi:biotin--[acetyl-CoA-carboxylase] ligase [Alkaliphilus serpentinus]|uniref:Bifunctional ligase/repressor BirA n=1 Tax=Alkaliphilus serpentinus TaxID=1482731 RepID=A0A833HRU1_9FIRM|nr:biotin--[acetyl-CoA-carboxylase] ligase [Alkaliphilus serpentinus]KAB3533799.1 biotin--[acetyl-CoA-carboxylase] ligase [Alkaliphilus serpentinus]